MSTKLKNTFRGMILGAFTAFVVMAMSSVRAEASSFTLTIDHCSGGGCGTTGSVTVTDDPDTLNLVHFLVQSDDFKFVNSTSHGANFMFNVNSGAGGPTLSFSNFADGWRANLSDNGSTQNAGSVGGGGWTFEYSVTCHFDGGACEGSGASTPANPPLTFDVTAPGLSASSFLYAGTGTTAIFAADVIGGTTGNTGLVGFTQDTSVTTTTVPTPEPASALLLVCGAIAIGAGKQFASKRK